MTIDKLELSTDIFLRLRVCSRAAAHSSLVLAYTVSSPYTEKRSSYYRVALPLSLFRTKALFGTVYFIVFFIKISSNYIKQQAFT
jgi:hypothetical protein